MAKFEALLAPRPSPSLEKAPLFKLRARSLPQLDLRPQEEREKRRTEACRAPSSGRSAPQRGPGLLRSLALPGGLAGGAGGRRAAGRPKEGRDGAALPPPLPRAKLVLPRSGPRAGGKAATPKELEPELMARVQPRASVTGCSATGAGGSSRAAKLQRWAERWQLQAHLRATCCVLGGADLAEGADRVERLESWASRWQPRERAAHLLPTAGPVAGAD